MMLNAVVTVANGQQEVTYVSGDNWANVFLPAFMQLSGTGVDPNKYWIAEVDTANGQWMNLAAPWPGANGNVPVVIFSDYTPGLNLPLANPGDVNIAELWNRAMRILDQLATIVPLHGSTHIGTGIDPVPLASPAASGLVSQLSGNSTDYVGGDNQCHPLSGLPTGAVVPFAGQSVPANWLLCDGGLYSRATYANLYAVLGGALSPWGQGDGHSTFNTPDLRGRVPMGAGAGLGLSSRIAGQSLGEELHTTTLGEMPAHPHTYVYDNLQPTGGTLGFTTGTYNLVSGKSATTGTAGGSAPHNNIQPSAVIQFIIRI